MKSRRTMGHARLVPPERSKYGIFGEGTESCPIPPGAKRRITLCQRAPKPGIKVDGPGKVCSFLRNASLADRESIYALHLDSQNRVIGVEEVAKGTLSRVETSPREFFKAAILNNAAGIIMAHNHPSGSPSPSTDDWQITKGMIEAGKVLGIPILDHVIVAEEGCTSLRMRAGMPGNPDVSFGGARRRRRTRR